MSQLTIISWAGMRGVVSLAAAVALLQDFPGRDPIVFLAFRAILVTLVLQGTTLGWLIRVLRVAEPADEGARALSQGETFDARKLHARARLELDLVHATRRAVLDRDHLLDGEELTSRRTA